MIWFIIKVRNCWIFMEILIDVMIGKFFNNIIVMWFNGLFNCFRNFIDVCIWFNNC